jgi:hypothetical protein
MRISRRIGKLGLRLCEFKESSLQLKLNWNVFLIGKKGWDAKFGPADIPTEPVRATRARPARINLPQSSSRARPPPQRPTQVPRPVPPPRARSPIIIDHDETEQEEKERLIKQFVRPGHHDSLAANHIGVLRIMAKIHHTFPQSNPQLRLSFAYVDSIPLLVSELTDRSF